MKNKYIKYLLIFLALAIIVIVAWFVFNANQQSQENNPPSIDYVYSISDFPEANMEHDSIQELVDRLNNNYEYLREEGNSEDYDGWISVGNIKQGLKDFNGAVEAWKYATVLNNANPLAFSNLANYYKAFAHDYEQAIKYYNLAIAKDNMGHYYIYEGYAELYVLYLPEKAYLAESIMLDGINKPAGQTDINFYLYLYRFFEGKDVNKVEYYKNKILQLDPNFNFDL